MPAGGPSELRVDSSPEVPVGQAPGDGCRSGWTVDILRLLAAITMNWLDILILALLAWFALAGLSAGILRETVTLIAAVLGVLVAGQLYKQLAADFAIFTNHTTVANIAAFVTLLGAVLLAGQITAVLLKRTAALLMLGPLDHIAGLFFGLVKGFVLVEGLLFLFAGYRVEAITHAMDGSLLTPLFLQGLPVLLHLLPGEFRQAVERFPS